MTGDDYNLGPDGRCLRRVVKTELPKEASDLYEAGGHSLGAVVRFMERKHNIVINFRSLRHSITV